MSVTTLLAIVLVSFEVPSLRCHRLITNPYPEQEWDSVIVSSDPITIREKTHKNDTTSVKLNEILKPQKRSYEECPQNDFACLYGNDDGNKDTNRIVDRFLEKYSHIADVKYSDEGSLGEKENENSRKSYWTMVDSQTHNHPFDDQKGWVTLDPVPWSSSKISKWQPNKHGPQQESKPWGYGSTTQRPAVQQFWVAGSGYQPQMPAAAQWGLGTNDIITDNKPSDFPSAHYHAFGGATQGSQFQSGAYPGSYNGYQQHHELKGGYPSRYPQNTHPSTYPIHNDGEWVLLSTTKGYSNPQRHRWSGQKNLKLTERNTTLKKLKPIDISKYHEEDLNEKFILSGDTAAAGNRKSDAVVSADSKNGTNDDHSEKTPLQILYTGSPKGEDAVTTFRRKVRLQVLPSLETSSTSYGGLLEVASSSQTVDEAQQEDEKLQKLKAIANVKKNRIRGYKLVPASKITGKGMNNKVMTLAAVGAGMIPATMALLVPMALGRKRRSVSVGRSGANWGEVKELKRW